MTNVKKKDGKQFGAIVLSLILLLSLVFPYPVMQTRQRQTRQRQLPFMPFTRQVMIRKIL